MRPLSQSHRRIVMRGKSVKPEFAGWRTAFLDYLKVHKENSNARLVELVEYLATLGCPELERSILGYLANDQWFRFVQYRRQAKTIALKNLTRSIRDLRRANKTYKRLLGRLPEAGTARISQYGK